MDVLAQLGASRAGLSTCRAWKNDPTPTRGLEPLLTVTELADYLGVPVATIYDWRVDGKGPRAIRIGRHLKFAASDVRSGLETKRARSVDASGQVVSHDG